MVDFVSILTASSFFRNMHEATGFLSMEAKIWFSMFLDSCTLTCGGAVTAVAIFLREVSAVNGLLWDWYHFLCVFRIPFKSCTSGLFVLLICAILHISELLHGAVNLWHWQTPQKALGFREPLPLVNRPVVLRLLMRHCLMAKSGDNPDQQRWDRRMTWRPSLKCWWISGCCSGSFGIFWRYICTPFM